MVDTLCIQVLLLCIPEGRQSSLKVRSSCLPKYRLSGTSCTSLWARRKTLRENRSPCCSENSLSAPSLYNIIIVNNSDKKTRSLVLCWASAQVPQILFPWVGCDGGDPSAAVVLSLCSYLSFSAFTWFPLICCWLLTLYSFALLMTSAYMCSVPYIFLFAGERRMIIMKRKNISNKEGRYPFYVFEHVQLLSHVWRSATLWSVTCQSPVSGTSQARLLEWADASCSWGSSWPRDWTYISCICRWVFFFFFFFLNHWATREAQTFSYLHAYSHVRVLPSVLRLS